MSFEDDDAQSCYFDAQSIAAETSELGEESLASVWRSDWSEGDANLADQFYSLRSATHVKDSSESENGHLGEQEFKKQKSYSRPGTAPSISGHLPLFGQREISPQRHLAERDTRQNLQTQLNQQRPSTSGGEYRLARTDGTIMSQPASYARQTRSKTISSTRGQANEDTLAKRQGRLNDDNMDGTGRGSNEDLFLELANDQAVAEERTRPTSHGEHTSSRLPFLNKRRSLPAESGFPTSADRRPKSSGHIFGIKATSRVGNSLDLQRHVDHHRNTPSLASFQADDVASLSSRSRSGAPHRYTAIPERTSSLAEQLRSPELPQYGRRRPSFGASPRQIPPKTRLSQFANQLQDSYSESPADSSEPKRSLPDSASIDSQTADTVWDELDDLKSRIKKLELTGKLPQTSGAAVSTEQNERPRTATTAPTTIDSSPKHEQSEKQQKNPNPEPESASPDAPAEYIVGGPDAANIHPNLHGALTKAKRLLNPSLYRSLEATAADALQLAAMTGSAGPQGTALTAAAIINGVTVSDRHVRRKADTMCRNLTDLVLALCEGKTEAPSMVSSPITINTPLKVSPTLRYSRNSLSPNGGISRGTARPMSRLEARRTSILGSQVGSNLGSSPLESGEDFSASEQESTKSYPRIQEPRGFGRATSRLQAARQRRYDEIGEDEDPTIRPPSRAMTDIGRAKPTIAKEYSTPHRSPSLRESLASRRANAASHESNRELSRVASLMSDTGRRRFLDPSTPPVLEEEGNDDDYKPASQPKRRVTSYGAYGSRRTAGHVPNRSTSLSQSRQVMVE